MATRRTTAVESPTWCCDPDSASCDGFGRRRVRRAAVGLLVVAREHQRCEHDRDGVAVDHRVDHHGAAHHDDGPGRSDRTLADALHQQGDEPSYAGRVEQLLQAEHLT